MAVRSLLRWCFAGSLLVSAACGVMFAPADYREGASGVSGDGAAGGDAAGLGDAAAPVRFVVIAGRRDVVDGDTATLVAETLRTELGADGQLLPWTYDVPPSVAASWSRAEILDGRLLVQTGASVYHAPFADGVTADFKGAGLRGGEATESGQYAFMFDRVLLSAGHFADGGIAPIASWARIDVEDGGVDGWTRLEPALEKPRASTSLARAGDLLYVIGGRDAASGDPAHAEVDVARLDAELKPGAFTPVASMEDPTSGAAHGVLYPMVTTGGGWLFVVGGQTTAAGLDSVTDVALAAKIDPASGELAPWVALPRLPTGLVSGALVHVRDTLYLFGGYTATVLSDAILALTVGADGTFGEWKRVGTLPSGGRGSLAVAVY